MTPEPWRTARLLILTHDMHEYMRGSQAVSLTRKTKVDKDGGTDPRWNEVCSRNFQLLVCASWGFNAPTSFVLYFDEQGSPSCCWLTIITKVQSLQQINYCKRMPHLKCSTMGFRARVDGTQNASPLEHRFVGCLIRYGEASKPAGLSREYQSSSTTLSAP